MNEEYSYLLRVLRCFLHNEDPGPFKGKWADLIHLADIHSVSGILGYMVKKYPNEADAPAAAQLRERFLQTIAFSYLRADYMKRLIQKMNEQEIDHLVFKGYVLREYYPAPELRSFGDIDFLIHEKDRQKLDALMIREGYEKKTDWEPVYSYTKDLEYYEVHTDVMEIDVSEKMDYREYFSHTWERARLESGHTWALSPEDHFIYVLTHIAKHINGSGAGIRMYMDVAVLVQRFGGSLDWGYIQHELQTLCFTDFANVVFSVVRDCFGITSPIPLKAVEASVLDDFMEFTMAGGTFGFSGRDSGMIYLKNQNRDNENVSKAKTFLDRLFPSAESIESRYTYLHGRHWLLPVAWLHRLIRTRDRWGYHAKETQNIMNADPDTVRKLRRIYKEIGL